MTSRARSANAGDLLARLPHTPDAYPQQWDAVRQAVLVLQLAAADFRAASFLDDRLLGPAVPGAWLPVDAVLGAARQVADPRPLHFVFHTGHVGSTLLSRLLDETGTLLPLREPLALRNLADAHDLRTAPDSLVGPAELDALLAAFVRLWRRGYPSTRGVVVKATSSAGRLAGPLLDAADGAKAVYLNLQAEPYLATLLAGQNSPLDLRGHGPGRMRRLQARLAAPLPALHTLSPGELAALSWLAETWSQHDAVARPDGRVIALDFDALLADVPTAMRRVLGHFGVDADAAQLQAFARSPVLSRYSKAPDHAYSPADRAALLDESRRTHGGEIRRGLRWLHALAAQDVRVARLLGG